VERLLAAAQEVASDEAVHRALVASTGLSPEGVNLALHRYLERDPPEEEIAKLVASATPVSLVRVILSANVLIAPLRALAVACAGSPRVSVKPSRRDPVLARELVRRAPDLGITLLDDANVAEIREGEIHVYGRDETIEEIRREAQTGVRVRGHGAGMGVAVVTSAGDLTDAAARLAGDVVVFDQRGCLSPRLALVVGDAARALAFGEQLDGALEEWATQVPRGVLSEDERRDGARYEETMRFVGRALGGSGHVVGVAGEGGALVIAPTGRHVHVMPVPDLDAARSALAPIRALVVALGTDAEQEVTEALGFDGRVRISPLGEMQKPPFDGPVDLRG